jgi:hypothetical protein
LSSYRALLARPGVRALVAACALGWVSFASFGLAMRRCAAGSSAAAERRPWRSSLCRGVRAREDVVTTGGAVEAFTWLTTSAGAGLAAGAAGAGWLTERGSPDHALWLVALPAILAAGTALTRRTTLRRPSATSSS